MLKLLLLLSSSLLLELTNTMILIVEILSGNCCNKENMLKNSTLSACQTLCLLRVSYNRYSSIFG